MGKARGGAVRNIVLTGFMGTGKSTVGRLLAHELGLKFIDMDVVIEKEAGATVTEIFTEHGEARFRELERGLVKRLADGEFGSGLVVSTGGGAVVDEQSRGLLRSWGVVVCLAAPVKTIVERVSRNEHRPLVSNSELVSSVQRLLEERAEAYRDSDLTVDTGKAVPEDVVRQIRAFLQEGAG